MLHGVWSRSSAWAACALTLGCGSPAENQPAVEPAADALLSQPLAELPAKLSAVGLYVDLRTRTASRAAWPYEPGYPLWSDGGEKQRFLVLPEGANIDASQPDRYLFPSGTLLFKTLAFRTAASPDQAVPIETRLLRLTDSGWEYAVYGWDDAGNDAELLDLRRGQSRSVLGSDGQTFEHVIPSRLECRQCHESAFSNVLGLTELQLAQSGSLTQLAARLEPAPHEPYAALPEHGPLTSAVLGYLVGNCVHCHNGSNGAASSFDLRPAVALDNAIDQPTASSATAAGIRVVPGKPEQSILYLGLSGSGDREVKSMPPVGVALRDAGAIQLLERWIRALADAKGDP